MKRSKHTWHLILYSALTIVGKPGREARGQDRPTATPIKHIVVIVDENISFDHYFATYPHALNPPNEPRFEADSQTPSANGLTFALVDHNPNFVNVQVNEQDAINPFRLDRSEAETADQDHGYLVEEQAFNNGRMDSFPRYTGAAPAIQKRGPSAEVEGQPSVAALTKGLVMGYYDGNTVTALWNYARNYAISDTFYQTTFGPSTLGAIELISGQTNGVIDQIGSGNSVIQSGNDSYTQIGIANPKNDICSSTQNLIMHSGTNIGAMLSRRGVTWGWFSGGFDLTIMNPNGSTGCGRRSTSAVSRLTITDYRPSSEPFQFFTETANPSHVRPESVKTIGSDGDLANHQYDLNDFFRVVEAGKMPAVSFLKAPSYQNGHPSYSNPLDEQSFLVGVINYLERRSEWSQTAVVIMYDGSDGWYDHQMGPIVNQSSSAADALTGLGKCGDGETALPGRNTDHAQGRCGYGPRLPLLVISPFSKRDYVDHTLTDQTSILRFIEDNWLDGERVEKGSFDNIAGSIEGMFDFDHSTFHRFFLDTSTGEVIGSEKSSR
jgi:phospholipase C